MRTKRARHAVARISAPTATVVAALIVLLGGILGAFLTPIGQRLFAPKESNVLPSPASHSTQASGSAELGDAQICWGQNPILPKGIDGHVRAFSFTFAKPFKSVPSVTIGINVVGSGYTFAVYNASVTQTTYTGLLVEQQSRNTEVPVSMSYTAIGPK
jgi:hypothetical protein